MLKTVVAIVLIMQLSLAYTNIKELHKIYIVTHEGVKEVKVHEGKEMKVRTKNGTRTIVYTNGKWVLQQEAE
jgi:hypothetical protein